MSDDCLLRGTAPHFHDAITFEAMKYIHVIDTKPGKKIKVDMKIMMTFEADRYHFRSGLPRPPDDASAILRMVRWACIRHYEGMYILSGAFSACLTTITSTG